MIKLVFAWSIVAIALSADIVQANENAYAVVVSKETSADSEWSKVVDALVAKHDAKTIVYDGSVTESLDKLKGQFPRYACFVARPSEAGLKFVADVHQLTRQLDDDPYTDLRWGILTGYDAENALTIAKHHAPLVIEKSAAGTEIALDMCKEGIWYCELEQNKFVKKEAGSGPKAEKGPSDTTQKLVELLNEYKPDLWVTSGHATERDWQIGFRYPNGQFRSKRGQLFGQDRQGQRFDVSSSNPKVYMPIGNCLMGHIDGPDAMALAYMKSAGVYQMLGYTAPTWFGYGGWGVLDYFVEQPGRYTFNEAFFANHHALIHALQQDPKSRGLKFDRDVVAFYGDPAWEARMAVAGRAYEQTLTEDNGIYTFEIKLNRGADSFKPINTNGAQRGWRPIVQFLPQRVKDVKIIDGDDLKPVITDDFILIPNPREADLDRKYLVRFSAAKL
ncbi:MAG: hypothetical protein SFV81_07950 [Pirellulaceae bacterium]|nr:hypothetical protein [Pirellulaceae bacterium]